MIRGRRSTTEESTGVPGQREESAPPTDDRDDAVRDDEGRDGAVRDGAARDGAGRGDAERDDAVREDAAGEDAGRAGNAPAGEAREGTGPPAGPVAPTSRTAAAPAADHKVHRTRLSGTWAAVVGFGLVLLLLLIFILQNDHSVEVSYFGAHGHMALGVAMLLAAVAGILLVALAGSARIMQLRATARKHRRAHRKAAKAQR